jgi:hypothetical protein
LPLEHCARGDVFRPPHPKTRPSARHWVVVAIAISPYSCCQKKVRRKLPIAVV